MNMHYVKCMSSLKYMEGQNWFLLVQGITYYNTSKLSAIYK